MRLRITPMGWEDLRWLERWLAAPHVARWWNEDADPASVPAKYGPCIDGTEPTRLHLIQLDGPIGFVQTYAWSDHAEHAGRLGAHSTEMGLDLAIGEVQHVGRGVGPRVLRQVLDELVWVRVGVTGCVTDPDVRNVRSVRAFEKAGFVWETTRRIPGPEGDYDVAVVRVRRPG